MAAFLKSGVCVCFRQGLGSGAYVTAEEQLQDSVYSNRGQYEEPPSSSRPRPVGGSTGKGTVCVLIGINVCMLSV